MKRPIFHAPITKSAVLAFFGVLVAACGAIAPSDPFPNDAPATAAPGSDGGTCFMDCTSVLDLPVSSTFAADAALDLAITACVDALCVERRLPRALAARGACEGAGSNDFVCAYSERDGRVALDLAFRGTLDPLSRVAVRIARISDGAVLAEAGPLTPVTRSFVACGKQCQKGEIALVVRDPSSDGGRD